MRIVAFSDSHGFRGDLTDAILLAQSRGKIDICVHCGDGADDFEDLASVLRAANPCAQLYGVRGNCDLGCINTPYTAAFGANGVHCMVAHGHALGVKSGYHMLVEAAKRQGAKVAFFGHTHVAVNEVVGGVTLLNPGAICNRRAGRTAYAEVVVGEDGQFTARLIPWLS